MAKNETSIGLEEASRFASHSCYLTAFPNFVETDFGLGTEKAVHFIPASNRLKTVKIYKAELGHTPSSSNDYVRFLLEKLHQLALSYDCGGAFPVYASSPLDIQEKTLRIILFDKADVISLPNGNGDASREPWQDFIDAHRSLPLAPGTTAAYPTYYAAPGLSAGTPFYVNYIRSGLISLENLSDDWLRWYSERAPGPWNDRSLYGELPYPRATYRFRQCTLYARQKGYIAGFPTFHEVKDSVDGHLYSIYLVPQETAEIQWVPKKWLPTTIDNFNEMLRLANEYANSLDLPGAFPTFFEQDDKYELVIFRKKAACWRLITESILGHPIGIRALHNQVANYALRHSFAAAFPTYQDGNKHTELGNYTKLVQGNVDVTSPFDYSVVCIYSGGVVMEFANKSDVDAAF